MAAVAAQVAVVAAGMQLDYQITGLLVAECKVGIPTNFVTKYFKPLY
jgi:hypothetical protein